MKCARDLAPALYSDLANPQSLGVVIRDRQIVAEANIANSEIVAEGFC